MVGENIFSSLRNRNIIQITLMVVPAVRSNMSRAMTHPVRRPPEVHSPTETIVATGVLFGGAMLVLLTLSHPLVGVGFAAGVLLRPLGGSLRSGGRQLARTVTRSLSEPTRPNERTPAPGGE